MGLKKEKKRDGSYYKKYAMDISQLIPESAVTQEDIDRRKNAEVKGKIKAEIFELISDYIFNQKSRLELINMLNENEKYQEYREFFGSWIEDTSKKEQEIRQIYSTKIKEGKNPKIILEEMLAIQKFHRQRKYIRKMVFIEDEKGIEHEHE